MDIQPYQLVPYMYVCMYVCMHACMHACMYVCIEKKNIYILLESRERERDRGTMGQEVNEVAKDGEYHRRSE